MAVNPGFGGQSFIEQTIPRVENLSTFLRDQGLSDRVQIEVDGGVQKDNASKLIQSGARILVAGTAVYQSADRAAAIASLRGNAK